MAILSWPFNQRCIITDTDGAIDRYDTCASDKTCYIYNITAYSRCKQLENKISLSDEPGKDSAHWRQNYNNKIQSLVNT